MATSGNPTDGEGLWAKLRRDAMPEKNSEPRPWTKAGGARPQSSAAVRAAGQSSGAPRKSFNSRTTGAPKKTGGSSNFDGGSMPGGQYLGGGGGGGKRGRMAAMDEELMREDTTDGDEEIPPEILAILEEDRFVKDVWALIPHSSLLLQ